MIQIAVRDRTVNVQLCYVTVEIRSNGRRLKGNDSEKRSFPYKARSAESKKRDKGRNLPPRDSLDVDRSIPVTETEVEFCDL